MLVMNKDVLIAEARKVEDAEAVAKLREAVAKNPEDHASWFELGMQYYNSDFHEARRCFSRAIAIEPFNAAYVFNRGRKCLSADDYEEAMADFATAIRLAPIDGFKWHYLANSHFFLESYAQAREYYYNAIAMYQKTGIDLIPPAVDWIWMCSMRLGDKAGAQAVLDKYITPDIKVEDSDLVYKKRVLLYAGYTKIEDFMANLTLDDDCENITERYAAYNYYRYIAEDMDKAKEQLDEIMKIPTMHHAFGFKLARKDHENWK